MNGAMMKRLLESQLFRNIVSNYVSVVWMGMLSLGFIPIYLRVLGPDQWGVVAVCMAVQGFLGLLDAGLGQIMPRDIALAQGNPSKTIHVFQLFNRSYLVLGLLGLLSAQLLVPVILSSWLHVTPDLQSDASLVLRLVVVQFFFQFVNSAHSGYWNGIQAQGRANFRQCLFGTLKHLMALTLVMVWVPKAYAYALPFALVSAVEWWFNRRTVAKEFACSVSTAPTWKEYKALAHNAGVLAVGVFAGMLVSQLDRIVLSGTLDASAYGAYVIVANLGLAFMQLQSPLVRAFFPRIVLASNNHTSFKERVLSLTIFALCVFPCLLVATATPWILQTWLSNPHVAQVGVTPLRLILIAVAINSVYQLVYQPMLALGANRVVVKINFAVLALISCFLYFDAPIHGPVAGGYAWVLSTSLQLLLGGYWMIRCNKAPNGLNMHGPMV